MSRLLIVSILTVTNGHRQGHKTRTNRHYKTHTYYSYKQVGHACSDVAFPEKYVENFPEIFQSRKISVAYFYILQYCIHIYTLHMFNI